MALSLKDLLPGFLWSTRAKLLLGLLAGLSASLLAGLLLSRHRRRYRSIMPSPAHTLGRQETFRTGKDPAPFHRRRANGAQYPRLTRRHRPLATPMPPGSTGSVPSTFSDHAHSEIDSRETTVVPSYNMLDSGSHQRLSLSEDGYASDSSNDSFHSTVENFEDYLTLDDNQLYLTAMDQVNKGLVHCRTMRTEMLQCLSDKDFLAKLFCVRLAFDEILSSQLTHRNYFKQLGMDIMSSFLKSTNQDPTLFCERYDDITRFLEDETNWKIAKDELVYRKVACMNVFDVALDFVLLDAFTDLEYPPSTVVAVLQNRWITDGMKKAALSAAVWSLLKAKKSMLKHKDGFMSRFYLLSETLTPSMAWGFLGTDPALRERCTAFRDKILHFLRLVFSYSSVRYTTVNSLADDIFLLAQQSVESLATM